MAVIESTIISKKRKRFISKGNEIDRLSSLPDNILIEILSRLPIKFAVITSVLSQQWRYLWNQVTNIIFDVDHFQQLHKSDFTMIDQILPIITTPKINFNLRLQRPLNNTNFGDIIDISSYVESWVRRICDRNPEHIQVQVYGCTYWQYVPIIPLPSCILRCQSLVVLRLIQYPYRRVTRDGLDVNLPNLKILEICFHILDSKLLDLLFKSCPVLEEATLSGNFSQHGMSNLISPSLKKLELRL
ncbi:F-box/LRR-repeat protein 13-like [Spinacia oleracea]|uniref:F-box/LRR-repeat protein 13-like n=1 Tax=Spinacia oleracea TaxID=3562 RepID=A0ABM3QZL1_SPIOL|nr:F-box/LRR-repeat protein 13-like [Spinacia oleracea]